MQKNLFSLLVTVVQEKMQVSEIREFVKKTGICSINTFMGKGVIPDDYDTHLQTIGIKDADHALKAVLESDVVISVGYDLVEYTPRMWNSELNKKIIHIDFTPSEVYTFYRPEVEIVSDIGFAISAILKEMEKHGLCSNPNATKRDTSNICKGAL